LRFIKAISGADLIVHDHTEASLLAELVDRGYDKLTKETEHGTSNSGQRKENVTDMGYDYLLELSIRIPTRDRVPALAQSPNPLVTTRRAPEPADFRTRLGRSKN
jgi:hypothetical protein